MKRLLERAEQLAKAGQRQRIAAIQQVAAEQVRGAVVETRENGLVIAGKRLLRRWLTEPALRFLGKGGR